MFYNETIADELPLEKEKKRNWEMNRNNERKH